MSNPGEALTPHPQAGGEAPGGHTQASVRAEPLSRAGLKFHERLFLAIENPVLRRELLTALRSNKSFILQFVFLLLLGAVVFLAWPLEETSQLQEKARTLFKVFGVSQLILVSILAPAFSASAMTIEKEKLCLDLLLTSPVRLHTILIGKYLSSVVYLMILLAATAPIVSACLWMPGAGPSEVLGLYLLLIAVAAAFGMVGLACSTFFHRTQTSLSITYLIVLPLTLILLIFAYSLPRFFELSVTLWPSGLLLAGTVMLYQASLRRLHRPFNPVFKAAEEEDITAQTGLVLVPDRFPDNLLAPPRSDELLPDAVNPVYHKEVRSEILGRGTLFLRLIIQISMFLSVVFLTFLYLGKEHIFVYYLIIFSMLVAPAFGSVTFTQERERRTLELLMTTLIRPAQVVFGKFLACCRLSFFLTGLVGITLLFYVLVGQGLLAERILALGAYLLILSATIVFETSLGMFCSMVCRSTLQSMIVTYATVLCLFGLPMAGQSLLLAFSNFDPRLIQFLCLSSPFQAAWSVSAKQLGEGAQQQVPELVWPFYLLFCLALSAGFLAYLNTRFQAWATQTVRAD